MHIRLLYPAIIRRNRALTAAMVSVLAASAASAQSPAGTGPDVIARVSDSVVLILTGEGAGRLSSTSTGVIVRPDGVILTAYHNLKNAREVQIRLRNGDVHDQAVLLGVDERRDVAALKIAATGLPALPLGTGKNLKPGETVYLIGSSGGATWSAGRGIVSASRIADEIPGAGEGFRVLQFTSPLPAGPGGGPLVDERGLLAGVITRSVSPETGLAVPIEAVLGLADGAMNLALGAGSALRMPINRVTPSSASVVTSDPNEILRSARTIKVNSRTLYFTPENLEVALGKEKDFASLALAMVKDARVADLVITVDRPLFTYTFTYSVMDSRTSLVVNTGRVTAIDGGVAAGTIAKQLVAAWKTIRTAENALTGK